MADWWHLSDWMVIVSTELESLCVITTSASQYWFGEWMGFWFDSTSEIGLDNWQEGITWGIQLEQVKLLWLIICELLLTRNRCLKLFSSITLERKVINLVFMSSFWMGRGHPLCISLILLFTLHHKFSQPVKQKYFLKDFFRLQLPKFSY